MGEAKRREAAQTPYETMLVDLSRRLTDEGRLIEAGFVGLRRMAIPEGAPQVQVDEMRKAYMAGAHYLFASIMTILDPGGEPTDADLRRMSLISRELEHFGEQLAVDLPVRGRA